MLSASSQGVPAPASAPSGAARRTRLVSRPRVVGLLEPAAAARLTVLSAPAGFGKSSALLDWLEARDVTYGWLTLQNRHNHPQWFLRDVVAACAPDPLADTEAWSTSPAALDPDDLVRAVLDSVAARHRDVVLVLDDTHVLHERTVLDSLQRLADHGDPLHLVLAGREDPPLRLSRLRLAGQLVELRADDLRFTVPEAKVFLGGRMGVTLADEDLALLVQRTEGWPAVLQLAALSLATKKDQSGFVRQFAATHRLVLDFVNEEVLDDLDEATVEFLLTTCVLDRLTGDLCDALTGRQDGALTLARLERANLLLVPLDDHGTWYRYHRLFADLLRARLRATRPAATARLNRQAAAWHLAHRLPLLALEHAVAVDDLAAVEELVTLAAVTLIHTGHLTAVRQELDRVPERLARSSPTIAALQAWCLALSGAPAPIAERWLAVAASAVEDAGPTAGGFAAALPGHAAMVRSLLARHAGRPLDAAALAEASLELVPDDLPQVQRDLMRGDALTLLGHALLDARQIDRAVTAYEQAMPLVELAGNRLACAEIVRNLALLDADGGRHERGLARCRAWTGDPQRRSEPSDGIVLLAEARILASLGSASAGEVAARASRLASRGGDLATVRAAREIDGAHRASGGPAHRGTGSRLLTDQELTVLTLVAGGLSNRQIAEHLFVTVSTVKSHLHAIAVALGTSNRVAAVVRARELGMLP